MTKLFFADTYALIELIGGGTNYKPYLNFVIVTTKYNLIELYYYLLRTYTLETAERYLELYSKFEVPISYNCIRIGMQFKLKHQKDKLSYIDCIGYALSIELGVKFLTGDQKFKNLENVEFVK